MASVQQECEGDEIVSASFRVGRSNRIVSIGDDEHPPSIDVGGHHHQDGADEKPKPGWKKFLSYVGPGFLVSLGYLDPGNLETDLQAGANHKYQLLWLILVGLIFALLIQSLAANLGVSTGKHLAELCKAEYPKYVRICLWLLGEVTVIAADIPEVIGTAAALNILFHIPLWIGVLSTGLSTLLLLGLQRFGARKLELLISLVVFTMAACFFGEMSFVKPPASQVLKGIFVPKLSGQSATADAIALIGALVPPHNLFLHSALVLTRKVPNTAQGINDACRYFLMETGFALFVAFLINVSILAVSGTVCFANNLSSDNANRCNNLTLDSASFLLKNVLGKSSSILYAIALLAAGQSATVTSTYAGQFIMQGFLDLTMKKWIRNLVTRTIAIAPSLVVSIIGGSAGAGRLIIIASMILSFEIPFVFIPLLRFSGSKAKMGPHRNSIYEIIKLFHVTFFMRNGVFMQIAEKCKRPYLMISQIIVVSWILGLLIIGINIYYLVTGFIHWLLHNNLPKVGNICIGLIVFPLMVVYILAVLYLTFKKDTAVTYVEPAKSNTDAESKIESGELKSDPDSPETGEVQYRQDLTDVYHSE